MEPIDFTTPCGTRFIIAHTEFGTKILAYDIENKRIDISYRYFPKVSVDMLINNLRKVYE